MALPRPNVRRGTVAVTPAAAAVRQQDLVLEQLSQHHRSVSVVPARTEAPTPSAPGEPRTEDTAPEEFVLTFRDGVLRREPAED